ncbi:MAG: AEC family transporter [Coriobacteriales bacterium]|jgi:predicted permease
MSLILAEKIFGLFLIIAMGFILVRSGLMRAEQSRGLSIACLYVISPCMIVTAFQVDATSEVKAGFLLAMGAGLAVQMLYTFLSWLLGRSPLKLSAVEKASVTYSNAGNLVIPLVMMTFGQDMVIYTTAYMVFQTMFMWSHGKSLLQGKTGIDLRQIFLSVQMIGVYIGLFLFMTGLRLPGPVYTAVQSVGNMIGPASMLVTGMIMGGMDFKRLFSFKRLPIPVCLRLLVFPFFAVLILKFTPLATLVSNGSDILMITLLAAAAPSASNINQMAQIFHSNAEYASAINVVTILLCIITIPLMVSFYEAPIQLPF